MAQTEEQEFLETLQKARQEFKELSDFQSESWKWVQELDDEGFFIFYYLLDDYQQNLISQKKYEEAVYTLVMLRHKFLPASLQDQLRITYREQLQILFSLYEKLKTEEMPWDACQTFIDEQLQKYREVKSANWSVATLRVAAHAKGSARDDPVQKE